MSPDFLQHLPRLATPGCRLSGLNSGAALWSVAQLVRGARKSDRRLPLLVLRAAVNRVFRTSMEVGVKVFAEDLRKAEVRHVASAYLTFVAIDANRETIPVPPAIPETDEEKRRHDEAGERRAQRLAMRGRT